jgi:hypothetical protein
MTQSRYELRSEVRKLRSGFVRSPLMKRRRVSKFTRDETSHPELDPICSAFTTGRQSQPPAINSRGHFEYFTRIPRPRPNSPRYIEPSGRTRDSVIDHIMTLRKYLWNTRLIRDQMREDKAGNLFQNTRETRKDLIQYPTLDNTNLQLRWMVNLCTEFHEDLENSILEYECLTFTDDWFGTSTQFQRKQN